MIDWTQHWLPCLEEKALGKKPVRVVVNGRPLVFSNLGKPCVLEDRCPHRNAPLSAGRVDNGLLVCPYHGWAFDGEGQCRRIPGRVSADCSQRHAAKALPLMSRDGYFWVHLGENDSPNSIYQPEHALDPEFDTFCWSAEMRGSLLNIAENFLDGTHTHYVHSGLIRSEGKRSPMTAEVICKGNMVEANYSGEEEGRGLWSKLMEGDRVSSHGRFIYPNIAEIETRGSKGPQFYMTVYLVPIEDKRFAAHTLISTPKGAVPAWVKPIAFKPFLSSALKQDKDIVNLQTDNIERFGEERFVSTELDLLRSHILTLFTRGSFENEHRRIVEMMI